MKQATPTLAPAYMAPLCRGFAILLLFLGAGECVGRLLALPIPGNVIGMALLTVALLTGIVKMSWVETAADALLSRLGLFFVPPGVAVMLYFDRIAEQWLPILVGTLVSILAVLWGTAAVATWLGGKGRHE